MASQPEEALGLLAVIKPPGPTSHDVVGRLRRVLGTRRVGHAGTLDPAAAGVLVVGHGKATRLLGHLRDDKSYLAEVCLGLGTDSGDAEGRPVAQADASHLSLEAARAALGPLLGCIQQRPPRASAVHIQGHRAHALMRAGTLLRDEDMPLREVWIHDLLLEAWVPGRLAKARLRVHCGTGTYLRSLAVDWGKALGVPASLGFLLRESVGPWGLDQAQSVEEVEAEGPRSLPWASCFGHLAQAQLHEAERIDWGHGRQVQAPDGAPSGAACWVEGPQGEPLGIGRVQGDRLQPEVVL